MIRFLLATCFGLLSVWPALAQQTKCSGPQLGTWKLISYTREEIATGAKTDLLGAHPVIPP